METVQRLEIADIKNAFETAKLPLDKIKRAKLNDGWYIYHPYGMKSIEKRYSYKTVSQDNGQKTVLRTKENVICHSDFLVDDTPAWLDMLIAEAKQRRG